MSAKFRWEDALLYRFTQRFMPVARPGCELQVFTDLRLAKLAKRANELTEELEALDNEIQERYERERRERDATT